ncbi:MAG: hypothetical protein Q9220_000116 [cf. Caloplaca sp. 1 TL-2023]
MTFDQSDRRHRDKVQAVDLQQDPSSRRTVSIGRSKNPSFARPSENSNGKLPTRLVPANHSLQHPETRRQVQELERIRQLGIHLIIVFSPTIWIFNFSDKQFQELLNTLRQPRTQPPSQVTLNHDRFGARDLGYFDPDDNASKPVESQEGKTVYHNVCSFTSRLRVKAAGDEATTVAKNLDQCLLDKAEGWFTEEISATTRAGLQTNVEPWCSELEARFREPPNVALARLESLRFTVADVRARRDPEEYVQQIIVNGKNAGTATTKVAQVTMAYNHLDDKPRFGDRPKQQQPEKYKGKGKRAYHIEVDSDKENHDPDDNDNGSPSDNSQGYEPEFYHGTPLSDDDEDPSEGRMEDVQAAGSNRSIEDIQRNGFMSP